MENEYESIDQSILLQVSMKITLEIHTVQMNEIDKDHHIEYDDRIEPIMKNEHIIQTVSHIQQPLDQTPQNQRHT
jgi:hypothetical protein